MRFAPIPKLPDGKQVLGCVHPTRSKDFAAFIADKSRSYEMTGRDAEDWLKCEYQNYPVGRSDGERPEDSTHPVVCVNHADAKAFCQWLTAKERSQSLIGPEDAYRLPTDHEWSLMVGIGDQEDPTAGPATKSGKIKNRYPWGEEFPPTSKVGNYADATAKEYFGWHTIPNYEDGFAATSPVMHFPANNSGFYDLGGNVWEWCEDWFDSDQTYRVLRGACWCYVEKSALLSSYRLSELPEGRDSVIGFRCVLEMGA